MCGYMMWSCGLHVLCCTHFVYCYICICFFFFKQKTAYEMRISDWSSDVCSSDLDMQAIGMAGNQRVQDTGLSRMATGGDHTITGIQQLAGEFQPDATIGSSQQYTTHGLLLFTVPTMPYGLV